MRYLLEQSNLVGDICLHMVARKFMVRFCFFCKGTSIYKLTRLHEDMQDDRHGGMLDPKIVVLNEPFYKYDDLLIPLFYQFMSSFYIFLMQ